MIQEKTRGNLSKEEEAVLRNTLSNLQMAFVEVSRSGGGSASPASTLQPEAPAPASSSPAEASTAAAPPPAVPAESESRKKFTKSYGA